MIRTAGEDDAFHSAAFGLDDGPTTDQRLLALVRRDQPATVFTLLSIPAVGRRSLKTLDRTYGASTTTRKRLILCTPPGPRRTHNTQGEPNNAVRDESGP